MTLHAGALGDSYGFAEAAADQVVTAKVLFLRVVDEPNGASAGEDQQSANKSDTAIGVPSICLDFTIENLSTSTNYTSR